MGEITDTRTNWLDSDQLELVRGQVPLVYIDAVPVIVSCAWHLLRSACCRDARNF
ncbi:MAG: DUF4916 domain-containing protein [Actinobacteria bacterium]|nr:DUF4916 domain-containing protein [Actinomycetota bacterium]